MNASSKWKTVNAWLDDRTGLLAAMRKCSESSVPGGVGWRHVWPSAILFTFVVQAITGFFLWMFYSPSTQTAWESVYYIQYEVAGGWLVRGIHHYSAQVLVALTGLCFLWLVITGAYRRPREFVFWTVVLMGLCALGGCLTGDLLAWGQNNYHATKTRVDFLQLLPLIGGPLYKLAAGGPEFGHHSLTRFFALHVAVVGGGFILLLLLYYWFLRRAEAAQDSGTPAGPYWPDQMLRNMIGAVVVMAFVLLLVFLPGLSGKHAGQPPGDYLGVELGAPGDLDPMNPYDAARPEWSFRGLYGFSNLFPGEWKIVPIFIVPGIVMAFVFLMPFVALWKPGHPVNLAMIGVLLLALVVLSYASWKHDWDDPNYLNDVAEGELEAERAIELAQASGIPRAGALALMATDPKIQGRRLFRQHCKACHEHAGPEGLPIKAEEPSAPNLFRFASRQRLAGFLDYDTITSPDYFGNTAFKGGDMVATAEEIRDELKSYDEDGDPEGKKEYQAELESILIALSAEAALPAQKEADAADAERIKQGVELMGDHGCTGCHTFHGKGTRSGPDLTGYGSREWLVAVIGNPADKRFYGERNDRMPCYLTADILSPQQIGYLADWLRGEWPVPSAEEEAAEEEAAEE